jgi:hypothetical protein
VGHLAVAVTESYLQSGSVEDDVDRACRSYKMEKIGGQTRGAVEGKGGRCRMCYSLANEGRCAAAELGGWSGSSGGRQGDRRTRAAGAYQCGGARAWETAAVMVKWCWRRSRRCRRRSRRHPVKRAGTVTVRAGSGRWSGVMADGQAHARLDMVH